MFPMFQNRFHHRYEVVSSGGHSEWTDLAFGEPSVTPLQDGTLLVTFWCAQPSGKGVQYVKLAMKN